MSNPILSVLALLLALYPCIADAQSDTAAARAASSPAVQTATGIFLYLEQDAYPHWFMRLSNGKTADYVILHPDKSLKKVLKNPTNHMNQACRIQWKNSVENLPKSGGKMPVNQILSVEWIGSPP